MKGNFHVQFLGEGMAVTSSPYPAAGRVTTGSTRNRIAALLRIGKSRTVSVGQLAVTADTHIPPAEPGVCL